MKGGKGSLQKKLLSKSPTLFALTWKTLNNVRISIKGNTLSVYWTK